MRGSTVAGLPLIWTALRKVPFWLPSSTPHTLNPSHKKVPFAVKKVQKPSRKKAAKLDFKVQVSLLPFGAVTNCYTVSLFVLC